MRIQENTIQLEVPDGRSFRLKECETFETVRGNTPRDVDVIWQNEGDERLWLVELKDYGALIPADPDLNYLKTNLTGKIRDTLYTLASVWAESDFGQQLRDEIEDTFPDFPDTACPLRPVAVLNLEQEYVGLFGALLTSLNGDQDLMSVLALMDVSHIAVVDPDRDFLRDELQVEIRTDT